MPKVSRRGFIAQTTASVATMGVLATMPVMALETETPQAASVAGGIGVATSELGPAVAAMSEPLIAHVSNFATGEISLMVGTQEIVYRDPELVQRLLRAIQ